MAGLGYVGVPSGAADGVISCAVVTNQIAAENPSQASVNAQLAALTGGSSPTYASQTAVTTLAASFAQTTYVTSRDALNIPLSTVGATSGVAALDSGGKVPLAQMPVIGAGYLRGPFGPTALSYGTASATPIKIADWQIGTQGLPFRALAFMSLFVTSAMGRPVVEVRLANAGAAVPYGSGDTLIARGVGRWLYNDYHALNVSPVPDAAGESFSTMSLSTNIWVSAWLYDLNNRSVSVSNAQNIPSAAVYLLRGS